MGRGRFGRVVGGIRGLVQPDEGSVRRTQAIGAG